jgi:LysR family transcriptional regulator, low CO2-responsive transcriptional regulator
VKIFFNECEMNSSMKETLDSRQLRAFVILARTGSHTETAKQLYVTHSAISHAMRALEEQMGCRLFAKLRKKNILTEAGEALLPHADRVLAEMLSARTAIAELNKWGSQRLRLAADAAFCSAILLPALLKFHGEFPQARLQVETCHSGDPVNLLEENRTDLVWMEKPPASNLVEFVPLLADRFVFVVNARHPWAKRDSVSRAELSKQPCLLLRRSSHGRKQMNDFLARREMELNVNGELDRVDALKAMIHQFPLMSFLPGWIVADEIKNHALIALPSGRKPFEQTWGLVHSAARPLNHAESAFLKFCRQRVAELG